MRKSLWVLMVVLALAIPAYAVSDNWVTNGDFENGLAGWTAGQFGSVNTSAQLFEDSGEVASYDYSGNFIGYAEMLPPSGTGYAVGFARSGHSVADSAPIFSFVSQTVSVPVGTYTVASSSWNAIAGNTGGQQATAAMFLMRIDGQIGAAYDPNNSATFTFRSTKWDFHDTPHTWVTKSLASGSSFTTTTGQVQFILAFQDNDCHTAYDAERYGYAAFDNFVFTTNEVVPEPSSMLALGTGLMGLAGFVIRRRR